MPSEAQLKKLHDAVTKQLTKVIKQGRDDGLPKAADINAAINFLKLHGISSSVEHNSDMDKLMESIREEEPSLKFTGRMPDVTHTDDAATA